MPQSSFRQPAYGSMSSPFNNKAYSREEKEEEVAWASFKKAYGSISPLTDMFNCVLLFLLHALVDLTFNDLGYTVHGYRIPEKDDMKGLC